jgi:hypothetical protein
MIKRIFEEVTELGKLHKVEYRFDTAESNGLVRKYFYFDEKLVGVGEDASAR